ncbi:MAG: hypothetical protein KA715_11090 [Xanthomonadaceae bacterium]|nr:hypothetical protein [Xanthomonadaceae bacterium]
MPAKQKKDPWFEYSLVHFYESLYGHERLTYRKMFGGLAIYFKGRLVTCIMQNREDSDWNGILIPTERDHHAALLERWPSLIPHKILPKWLYLSMSNPELESIAPEIVRAIEKSDPRIGIEPKSKNRAKKSNRKAKKLSSQ